MESIKKDFPGLVLALALVVLFCGPAFCGEAAEQGDYIQWSQGVYHTVEKGDTLWDLSEKFYDTPAMWPELWHLNPDVGNPHWIYPGEVVNLYEAVGEEYIPPPVIEPLEPMGPRYYRYASIRQVGFVRKQPVKPVGKIIKAMRDPVMITQSDTVYIKPLEGADYVAGDRLTIWRKAGEVFNPYGSATGREMGVQHMILGQAILVAVRPEVWTARIEQAYRSIHVGDLLMPLRKLPGEVITMTPGKAGMEAYIVIEEDRRDVFGDGNVVFLDKGKKDGLETGQVYTAYYEQGKVEGISIPSVDAAHVMVLLAEQDTATALITRSVQSMSPGARIHAEAIPLQ